MAIKTTSLAQKLISVSVIFGIITQYLFYGHQFGLQKLLFVLLELALIFGFAKYLKRPVSVQQITIGVAAIALSAFVAVRDASSLVFFNSVASDFLILYLLLSFTDMKAIFRSSTLETALAYVLLPLEAIGSFFIGFRALHSDKQTKQSDNKRRSHIIIGTVIASPIIFVFTLLFASADPVFNQGLEYVFDNNFFDFNTSVLGRVLVGLIFASFAFAGLTLAFVTKTTSYLSRISSKEKKYIPDTITNTVLGLVASLFAIFIVIQITYLFGGAKFVTETNITYAEYARTGFFQLLWVAILSYVMMFSFKALTKHTTKSFSILSGVLIIEVLIIMASSLKRLALYEDAFGFTLLRLYSHSFIFFLFVAFTVLGISIYKKLPQYFIAQSNLSALILYLILLNLINPHAFIAKQNVEHYEKTGKIDIEYLASLSDDAVGVQLKVALDESIIFNSAANDADSDLEITEKIFKHDLFRKLGASPYDHVVHPLELQYSNDWRSYNVSRAYAKSVKYSNARQLGDILIELE